MVEFPDLNILAWFKAFRELKNAGYTGDFICKLVMKSGVNALSRAKQLVNELENMGLSKPVIERTGANLGLSGLIELKGLRNSRMPESDIVKKLSKRINVITSFQNRIPFETTSSPRIYLLNTIENDKRLTYSVSALISSLIILSLAMSIRLQMVQANYFTNNDYLLFIPQRQQIWITIILISLLLISLTAMLFTIIFGLKRKRSKEHMALIKKYFCYEFITILVSSALLILVWLFIFHNYSYITENGIRCRSDYYRSEEIFAWDDIDMVEAEAHVQKSFLSEEQLELTYVLHLVNGRRMDLWQARESLKNIDKIDEINKILISQNTAFNIAPIDTETLQQINNKFSGDKLDQVKRIYHI